MSSRFRLSARAKGLDSGGVPRVSTCSRSEPGLARQRRNAAWRLPRLELSSNSATQTEAASQLHRLKLLDPSSVRVQAAVSVQTDSLYKKTDSIA